MAKKEFIRRYRIGNNHERILLSEEIRETKKPHCSRRRISETNVGNDVIAPVNLNALAAQLPCKIEGQWIVEVVRSFGKYRGIHSDAALRDPFHEAVAVAIKAAEKAVVDGGEIAAYVKQAVRSRLTDLQRKEDYRDARLENDETKVLVRNPFGDFHTALRLVSPKALRLWRAYRKARGVMSAFAAELGTSTYLAETKEFPILKAEFEDALATVKFIRKGGPRLS